MSHEIEHAVFSAAEGAGWTGLGKAIPADIARDPAQIAALCGATWTVSSVPVYRLDEQQQPVAITGAAAQLRSDTGRVLSLTSDTRYHVANRQPVDVFEAFRDELAAEHLTISHGAVLRGGQIIAVSALLPPEHDVTVGRGDRLNSYVTLSTGYDAKHGTKATKGTIRVVCANTLASSLEASAATGTLRTIRASTQLEYGTLKGLISDVQSLVEDERRQYNAFANAQMTDADVMRYFADVLEINIEQLHAVDRNGRKLISSRLENQLKALVSAYNGAPGAGVAQGTAWGALNAVTYYGTHESSVRDTSGDGIDAARVASNFSGGAALMKSRALLLAQQFTDSKLALAA